MNQTINFTSCQIVINDSVNKVEYSVQGKIDERFSAQDIPCIRRNHIHLNLKAVSNFTSSGINHWIAFISKLSDFGQPILDECSISFMDHANMIPRVLGNCRIHSFLAPYECECGLSVSMLIVVDDHNAELNQSIAPSFVCQCGNVLIFDGNEESYFSFIASTSL
ncbi:MAG: hypothetical protein M3Q07_27720 [Pseudobdellovibrionaceae bacterium]|nr:hypothetical protein [Pseudobdellovibrionaceae bacterium]